MGRILVVDDDPGVRQTLAASLELHGFEVVEASSAEQGLDKVREETFDLVVSDIRMPGMNGVQLFREVRRVRPDLPVVLITGFEVESWVEEAIQEGAFTVVEKPVRMERFIQLAQRAIRSPTVLVVDDQPGVADSMVAALNAAGLRAAAAHDGEAAMKLLKEQTFDVCVLDLVMPEVTGVEMYAKLQKLDPSIGVVAMTGHDVNTMMTEIVQMGAFRCLRKPFDTRSLIDTIGKLRGRSVSS